MNPYFLENKYKEICGKASPPTQVGKFASIC